MTWGVLVLAWLASYRVTRFVTTDALTESARQALVRRYPPHIVRNRNPRGEEIPNSAIPVPSTPVKFVNCPWCVGVWTSLAVVLVAHCTGLLNSWQLAGLSWLAISTAVGFLSRLEA